MLERRGTRRSNIPKPLLKTQCHNDLNKLLVNFVCILLDRRKPLKTQVQVISTKSAQVFPYATCICS